MESQEPPPAGLNLLILTIRPKQNSCTDSRKLPGNLPDVLREYGNYERHNLTVLSILNRHAVSGQADRAILKAGYSVPVVPIPNRLFRHRPGFLKHFLRLLLF